MFVCIFSIALVGCSGKDTRNENNYNNNVPPKEEVIVETAYDKLSTDEKMLFDSLCVGLDRFKNPTSVIVKTIVGTWNDMEYGAVEITAQNGFGGTDSNLYVVLMKPYLGYSKSLPNGYIFDYNDLMKVFDDFRDRNHFLLYLDKADVKNFDKTKINAALKEYKTEQGYI